MWNHLAWAQIINIPTPAVGQSQTRIIPGETFERLESVRFQLVASAAVANRFATIEILDGDSGSLVIIQGIVAITAGQTFRATFARGISVSQSGGVNEQLLPLPDTVYPPGCRFRFTAGNLDAGDQISTIKAVISRYPSDKWLPSPGATPYQE